MSITTFFVDLDDTVYPASSGIWSFIRQRMAQYMHDRLGLSWEEIPLLRRTYFETYGTTMRGLQACFGIDEEDFLMYVHDVPVEATLAPDPQLREILSSYPQRKIIFTNADRRHAERVLKALAIRECFEEIIDIHVISPACKPQPGAYLAALRFAGETDASRCAIFEDSIRNLEPAREMGFCTVLVGSSAPEPSACYSIASLKDLPQIMSPLPGE